MSTIGEAAEVAAEILKPLSEEVARWIHGDGERRPKVLALLPNELQSEIALKRMKNRVARGLQTEEPAAAKQKGIVLPQQKSSLRATLGPKPTS